MGQVDVDEKVKGGQNLARMNLIVKRIESELDQLKNLINEQIDGLTTTSPSSNYGDPNPNCDTLISITNKESYYPMDTTAEDDDKVSNSNYQYEFSNKDQEVECQNRPSNEDELILGGLDFNCEIPSKNHVDPSQSLFFTSFQNQDKVIIQVPVGPVDFKPDFDSIQISNDHLEGLLERAEKNDKGLSQKLIVQMGVRCDKNPSILHSNRHKEIDRKTEKSQSKSKIHQINGKRIISAKPKPKGSMKKMHNCSFCSKSFQAFSALSIHLRVHTGERAFKCKICSKSFSRMDNLKRHNLVHTGEKPYSCSVCSRAFALSHHLKDHMRVHTGEKPFSCSVCLKSFARNDQLNHHMLVHKGQGI